MDRALEIEAASVLDHPLRLRYDKGNTGRTLRYGTSTSCGCLKAQRVAARSVRHGMCKTSLYFAWNNMKGRCTRPSRPDYVHYGARGVRVCQEWVQFSRFKRWAEKNGYVEGMTLELIDGTKYYSPDNCRWVRKNSSSSDGCSNASPVEKLTHC